MKTHLKISSHLILMLLLITFSCSSDDDNTDSGESSGINAQNLVTNFNENPTNGSSVGTIQAISNSTLSYSITSQTPNGALSIDPSTGELKVANATLFDFETNPIVNASISIISANSSTTATAIVNLTNLDDIESFLTTSKADYIAAIDGDWIIVTEAEYNTLATKLNYVSRAGLTENEYTDSSIPTTGSNDASFVVSYVTSTNMPANSFVFAFKYHAFSVTDSSTSKVKQSSTSISNGYSNLGNALPLHSGNQENICFVLKGGNSITTNEGYLAFHKPETSKMGLKAANNPIYFQNGDVNDGLVLSNNEPRPLYQGLSTTQKQW